MVSNEYGMICWSGETDISGVDFTKDLVLEKGGCEVYPNGNAPPRGTKLNKHAIITLLRIEFFLPAARILPSDAGRAENPGNGRPIHFL